MSASASGLHHERSSERLLKKTPINHLLSELRAGVIGPQSIPSTALNYPSGEDGMMRQFKGGPAERGLMVPSRLCL